jgi:hypothetical protein
MVNSYPTPPTSTMTCVGSFCYQPPGDQGNQGDLLTFRDLSKIGRRSVEDRSKIGANCVEPWPSGYGRLPGG